MKKKILISTGGSGGHVIPALNFYEHLKENNEVFLTSDLRGLKFIDTKIYNNKIIPKKNVKIMAGIAIILINLFSINKNKLYEELFVEIPEWYTNNLGKYSKETIQAIKKIKWNDLIYK